MEDCDLNVSLFDFLSMIDKGYDGRKYKNNTRAFNLGIKLYQFLGLDHRIRK